MSLCIALHRAPTISETFIRSHAERLGGGATLLYGEVPYKDGESLWSDSAVARLYTKGIMLLSGRRKDVTHNYLRAFRKLKTSVVLAEYGMAGVLVMEACRRAKIPLIVHFHGFDASVKGVLEKHRGNYRSLFEICAAIVVPSRAMKDQLISLGAPSAKIACNPYGVDCSLFKPAEVEHSPPVFLAVGRFVDKKGPHLTIVAFAEMVKAVPEARLRMIGDGPLLGACQDLARALGICDRVIFLGAQPHARVAEEMQAARAFIQHSVEALNGDSEGMPVSIMEAAACGLPVVSTRHAGIPEIVVEKKTGFLVDERDVSGMARHMRLLGEDPGLASGMGQAARRHIESSFSMEKSLSCLSSIIAACTEGLSPRRGLTLAAYERS